MKRLLAIVALLVACTNQSVAGPSPSPTSPAQSAAADLRTRMDLLLGEQVMIVAKESAAAVNHSDEYTAYASMLGLNAADLSAIIARAYGNTAGVQFMDAWSSQNGFLVDYAIGVVTHNAEKTNAAMNSLTATFTPGFTQLIANMTRLPNDPTNELVVAQITEDKTFIDDVFAGSFSGFYPDLHRAYAHSKLMGDLVAGQMAVDFPDKFPGDPSSPAVDRRVTLNLELQEQSYVETLATDARVNHRDLEASAAQQQLSLDTDALTSAVEDARFSLTWRFESTSLLDYAAGNVSARTGLTQTVPSQLTSITKALSTVSVTHENAIIKVVDDQRAGAPTVADDDRAAATSMQPIADSVK